MNDKVNRDDIEKMLWRWTEWKANQRAVDAVMGIIDQYTEAKVSASRTAGNRTGWPGQQDAERAAVELLEQARTEAAQILQSARDQAAVRPVEPVMGVCRYREPEPASEAPKAVRRPAAADPDETTRTCTRCKVEQDIEQFHKDVKSRGGRKARCVSCESLVRKGRTHGKPPVTARV